jgi:hypothetical protein
VAETHPELPSTPAAPQQEYTRRLDQRRQRAGQLEQREQLLGNARVGVFLLGLGVAWLIWGSHLLHPAWLLAPIFLFGAVLILHDRATRSWYRARRAVAFYEAAQTRLAGGWKGRGQTGARFLAESHLYAADLDLFGPGSLFELLCTTRTRTGEDTLASWLLEPAAPEEIGDRQAAVAELRPQLDLREDLAVLGGAVPTGVDFTGLAAWGAEPTLLNAAWPRWLALGLGVTCTVLLIGWVLSLFGLLDPETVLGAFFYRSGSLPFVVILLPQLALAGWLRSRVQRVLEAVERRGRDVALLANLLARLEQARFQAPLLRRMQEALNTPAHAGEAGSVPPSRRIAQLGSLLELLDSRRNQLFAPFAYLLLWGTQMAHAIERWRGLAGPAIARWLDVVGRLEALSSLAAYAYDNPDDPFPEIVTGTSCYEGQELGHPLLPADRCVRNDLRLTADMRLLIVSGSNMSGKSTFLRTVGINAVLALAGAPVRARSLRISPLAVGATLRIQDSLQAGRSRFYAEILRLRQVVDLSRGKLPLLFLLDELFAGTNSHDRRLGAEAVVRGLVDAGAMGLITTHDLSLTHIAEQLAPRAANVHFADHFENGVITFDYRLRPGVVDHSNALALMRAVGLEV